jgi:subtilisin family serine protease
MSTRVLALKALSISLMAATGITQAADGYRMVHHADLAAELDRGGVVAESYGALAWVRTPEVDASALFALELGNRRFDPVADADANQRVYGGGPALRLLQFNAPPRQQWLDALQQAGVTPIQYIAPYSYVVWADAASMESAARAAPALRWTGDFLPRYKQNNAGEGLRRNETRWQAMLYRGAAIQDGALQALGAQVGGRSVMDRQFEVVRFDISDNGSIARLATLPGLYSLQPLRDDGGLRGELANQITAGNMSGTGTPLLGYLPWLNGLGINGSGVTIANVDGGIFHTHPDLVARMLPCVGDTCGGAATNAHGTHTAAIMAGDGSSGVVDSNGFLRGLGMAPGANLVEQVYGPTFTQPGGMLKLMRQSHDNGADLSGNSWGPAGSPVGYDLDTRQVDVGVRDTKPEIGGDQPLTYVLSFMNGNGGTSSQGSPDEGKNMITVGSTKAQTGAGAFIPAFNDVSSNSAHGPALDGRRIPHLVAPGCSVDSANSATGYGTMCGTSMASPQVAGAVALFIQHYRSLHAGASPSAALIKAALIAATRNLAGSLDADGGTLGNRPDNKQGWGRLRADWMLAPGVMVLYRDQDTHTFDNTGETWTLNVSAEDPGEPMQIVLVYTDAPGHGTGGNTPAWNNDLDLRVTQGGNVYRGNVFGANGFSSTGGSADTRNNIEAVMLDAATAAGGGLAIEVVASNISSDALPNSGDATDQDFALVCVNCVSGPGYSLAGAPSLRTRCGPGDVDWTINVGAFGGYAGTVALSAASVPSPATALFAPASVVAPGSSLLTLSTGALADGSYLIDVLGDDGNENRLTRVRLDYNGNLATTPTLVAPADASTEQPLRPLLQWAAATVPATVTGYRVEIDDNADFGSIEFSAETSSNELEIDTALAPDTQYHWRVVALNGCGETPSVVRSFSTAQVYCATPAIAIPDGSASVTSVINIATGGTLTDLNVALAATHGWVGDLVFTLSKTGGPTVSLFDRPGVPGSTFGCGGDNFDIVLDDEEPVRTVEASCSSGTPAYINGASYQPNQPLSAFDGGSLAGTWTITASDAAGQFAGTLDAWCLLPTLTAPPVGLLFSSGFE